MYRVFSGHRQGGRSRSSEPLAPFCRDPSARQPRLHRAGRCILQSVCRSISPSEPSDRAVCSASEDEDPLDLGTKARTSSRTRSEPAKIMLTRGPDGNDQDPPHSKTTFGEHPVQHSIGQANLSLCRSADCRVGTLPPARSDDHPPLKWPDLLGRDRRLEQVLEQIKALHQKYVGFFTYVSIGTIAILAS